MPRRATESMPKPTARRREREREARRQFILDVAKDVFAERGFLGATIEEIAARCELAVGTLYRYFQSKEELYVSLLFEAMDLFREGIERAQGIPAPPDEQLRTVWRFFYDFYTDEPEYYRALMFLRHERLRELISAEVIEEINRRARMNFRRVGDIVRAGVEARIYRPELDSRSVADVLWSTLMGLVELIETRRNLGLPADTLESLHRQAFEWLDRGLRR